MDKKHLISIAVSTGSYTEFIEKIIHFAQQRQSHYTCVANVHMLVEAYSDKNFSAIVTNADVTTPDGKPLTWAMKMLHGLKQPRVSGMDLVPDLLKAAVEKNISVYLYGGTEEVMQPAIVFLKSRNAGLQIAGYDCPPFRAQTEAEEVESIRKINHSGAGLVFVMLGCPKQEKWMASMKGRVHSMMVGVGAALPVAAGLKRRAPRWMQNSGLEWMFRLCQEPGRLFRRYAITNSMFLFLLAREVFTFRLLKNQPKSLLKKMEGERSEFLLQQDSLSASSKRGEPING